MSVADATLAVQAAIIASLRADAAVAALVAARVHDAPPQGVAFPYVSLGPERGEPWEGTTMEGWSLAWQIDTWSRVQGGVEARRIIAAIADALHRETLTVAGAQFVAADLTFQTTLRDPDGITTHGVQSFRFLTHT